MLSRRETWAQRICESGNVGRYLLPGRDLELLPVPLDFREDDLRDFLERLDASGASTELLASAYWLSQPVAEEFFLRDLPILLKNLGHGSRASPPKVEPNFKGRVLWQETILGRLSGAVPRGRYLVSHVEKSADIPENQLLKSFLHSVARTSSEMARRGTGSLPVKFAQIRDIANRALANTYVQAVTLPPRITARMLNTARRHRDFRYSRLAALARDFDAAVLRGKWGQIIELLRGGWLAPITSADLFELYALIIILQMFEFDLGYGRPTAYGLIQRGRSAVATFKHPIAEVTVDVFFDQVPSKIFESESEYLTTASLYTGITAQERRPDIILRFRAGTLEHRLIVEVKETEDGAYMRDSIYKVLAYVKDFSSIWHELTEQKPKAVLMFPTGVGLRDLTDVANDIWLVSADKPEALKVALESAISGIGLKPTND